jgi:hypothetical protein
MMYMYNIQYIYIQYNNNTNHHHHPHHHPHLPRNHETPIRKMVDRLSHGKKML